MESKSDRDFTDTYRYHSPDNEQNEHQLQQDRSHFLSGHLILASCPLEAVE